MATEGNHDKYEGSSSKVSKLTVNEYIDIVDQQENNSRSPSNKSYETCASRKSSLARRMEQEVQEKMAERVNRFKRLQ